MADNKPGDVNPSSDERLPDDVRRAEKEEPLATTETRQAPLPSDHERKLIQNAQQQVEEMPIQTDLLSLTDSIEGYEILREIHRGGQGVVYQAVQKSTKRKVAIKVLLEGPYASKSARRRFEREIELVAQLKHPNIIGIFHSGRTSDGRQYCVMDYVRGVPLDQYVHENKLTLEDALNLFAKVCEAVNYAHQKGVIHRDLKPSNILVDSDGVPKVLDFGLAKQMVSREASLISLTGQVVGTLPYMSPEQAEGNPDKIDIRTDVYALGVILYQMLTGHYPYPVAGQMADVLKHIAETPPTLPSRSWKSESGVTQRAHKRIRPGQCPIDNEVQTIVMRTLAKERERRYQSAGELAKDVAHYLADEPIDAKRDSAFYVIRKQLHRYKLPVAVAVAFVVVITMSLVVSVSLWRQAERDRVAAVLAEQDQSRARKKAVQARDEADKQKQQARQQSYLSSIFAADAAIQANEIATARSRLDAAPSEFRNWEWGYLHAALDQSITPVLLEDGVPQHIIAISPDATRAVTRIVDGVHTIWNLDTGKPIAHFQREANVHDERPLRFSPDGTRIVAMLDDNTARIWDTATGKQLLVLRGRKDEDDDQDKDEFYQFHSVSFSPDMTRIVTTLGDMTAYTWDAATGEQLAVLPKIGSYSWWASFSPDGTRIVIASWNSFAHIWDAATGEQLYNLDGGDDFNSYSESHGYGFSAGDDHVQPALFSPDGTRIVTASVFHTARVSDAATGESLTVFRQHDDQVRSASFSPDGKRIVTASGDKTARIWDATTGEQLFVLRGHDDDVNTASFSPDGTRVVTASSDRTVRTWDAATGKQLAVYRGHESPVYSVAFTPDGLRIVSASEYAANIWDATANDQLLVISTAKMPDGFGWDGIESVSFSPDGARIMTNSSASYEPARIWDTVTGNQLGFLPGFEGWAGSASLSPDGFRVVTSSGYSDSVSIWNAATGEQRVVLSGQDNIGSPSFSPDGTRIVTVSYQDKMGYIWNAITGKQLAVLKGHEKGIKWASFNPNGTWIVTASYDETARVWDATTGEQLFVLRGHEGDVLSASFSPYGTRIVTASSDNTARIWDAMTGDQLTVLRGHKDNVNSASFNADGTRIVTTSRDNTARIWDAATGEQLLVLRGQEFAVYAASFSPDGTRIVTGHDSTIRVWDSVPYAQRYRQKQAYERAKPKAARVLDLMMATAPQRDGAPDLRAVAKSIRTDPGIDETVRHVAINLLMRRADRIRSKANALKKESAEAQEDAAEAKNEATSQQRKDAEESPTSSPDAAADDEPATTQPAS